jgi:hypothetical protein
MMIDSYHFDKTPIDAERETPVEDFADALYAAGDAVASTSLGGRLAYVTVCPGWSESYRMGPERGTLRYEPREYTFMVSHDNDPTEEDTDEHIREHAVRDAAIRMACWVALGEDPSDAPYSVAHYVDDCERRYYEAGGFGPEPEIDWPEDQLSPEFEEAEATHTKWYAERAQMFWDLIVYKATDVVANHHEAIVRVGVALCYGGTLSGSQVAEIVKRVEGAERSAA